MHQRLSSDGGCSEGSFQGPLDTPGTGWVSSSWCIALVFASYEWGLSIYNLCMKKKQLGFCWCEGWMRPFLTEKCCTVHQSSGSRSPFRHPFTTAQHGHFYWQLFFCLLLLMKNGDSISNDAIFIKKRKPKDFCILAPRVLAMSAFMQAVCAADKQSMPSWSGVTSRSGSSNPRQRFGRAPTERFSCRGRREQNTAGRVLHIDGIWKLLFIDTIIKSRPLKFSLESAQICISLNKDRGRIILTK